MLSGHNIGNCLRFSINTIGGRIKLLCSSFRCNILLVFILTGCRYRVRQCRVGHVLLRRNCVVVIIAIATGCEDHEGHKG